LARDFFQGRRTSLASGFPVIRVFSVNSDFRGLAKTSHPSDHPFGENVSYLKITFLHIHRLNERHKLQMFIRMRIMVFPLSACPNGA